ncbi:MAG TPA: gluconate 2-dehydrogenase subunit 3 family protein [Longimicrobiaceae bacterium]|nr:gluconate 2-dehydrogenase subunit 3 family protein [Longimicrobiaceae bacterium]
MPEPLRTPYAGYDVLRKWDTPSWNDQTREVVGRRLHEVPERRFLRTDEWATLEAVCARLLPQPDRPDDPVPIVPWIDRKLDLNEGAGYRYETMPPLREAWRLGIAGIEKESGRRHGARFSELAPAEQDGILRAIQEGEVSGEPWDELPPVRFFAEVLLKGVVGVYYSHPAAWSEIGYSGPASPRGYVRLGADQRDPWEAEERDA